MNTLCDKITPCSSNAILALAKSSIEEMAFEERSDPIQLEYLFGHNSPDTALEMIKQILKPAGIRLK
jgi:hypothetical protein